MDRRQQGTVLRPGQERLALPRAERAGRGVREEDIPLSPAYMDGGNLRDAGMRRGRDIIPDDMPPIRRMKAGGAVRGDGCCQHGKTKGRFV